MKEVSDNMELVVGNILDRWRSREEKVVRSVIADAVRCGYRQALHDTGWNSCGYAVSGWWRSEFASVWVGPDVELIVVQNGRSSEAWKWTARGWREPSDGDYADAGGWCNATSRGSAETDALRWYLEK